MDVGKCSVDAGECDNVSSGVWSGSEITTEGAGESWSSQTSVGLSQRDMDQLTKRGDVQFIDIDSDSEESDIVDYLTVFGSQGSSAEKKMQLPNEAIILYGATN